MRQIASRRVRAAAVLGAAVAAGLPAGGLWAAPATWDGDAAIGNAGSATLWSDANSWTTNGAVDTLPANAAPGDDVTFGNGTVGAIDLTANRVVNSLSFSAGFTLGLASTTLVLTDTTGNVTVNTGVTGQLNAVLAGANGLTVAGGGTLQLNNAASTFTGNITVNGAVAGTALAFLGQGNNATNSLGAGANKKINLINGGILRPVTAAADPSANSKEVVIGAGGGTIDTPVQFTLNDANQFSGTGDMTKTGTGLLILGQASTGYAGFTGAINLNAGTIQAFNASSLGTAAAGTTVASGAVLDVQAVTTEPVTVNGTGLAATPAGALIASAGTGAVGAVTLGSSASIGGNGTLTVGAVGEASAGLNLTKVGTGLTTLSAANTYTGTTTVSAGTLLARVKASLPADFAAAGRTTIAAGSTLVLGVGGAGEFTTADVDALAAGATFSAVNAAFGIDTTNAPGGTLNYGTQLTAGKGFAKFGTGTLNLTAAGSALTGPLTVSGGTLDLAGNDLGLANATLINGTGGTINATGGGRLLLNVADGDIGSTGTLTINAVIASGTQTSVDFFGGGTVVLTANNTFTGTADIQNNTVSVATIGPAGTPAPLGTNATVNVGSGGSAGVLRYTGTGESVTRTINLGGTTGGGGIDQSGTGVLRINTLTVNGAGSKTFTLTGSTAGAGEIAPVIPNNSTTNTTALLKSGTGTWTLLSANTYTGATSINQGTLVFAVDQTLAGGLNFGSANNITTAGTLDLSAAAGASFGGAMVVQTNTATANAVTIGAGRTLAVAGNVTIGSGAGANTVTNFTATGAGAFTVTNTAAAGAFTVGGSSGTSGVGNTTTADFSGLASMNVNLSGATSVLTVNPNITTGTTNIAGKFAVLRLASTSTITAATINVGTGPTQNGDVNQVNRLVLGDTANTINANTLNVGAPGTSAGARDVGAVAFGGATGTIRVRAQDGTGRTTALNLGAGTGVNTGAGNPALVNTFDVAGHDADLLLGAVAVGTQNRAIGYGNLFAFDTGTLDMTSLAAGTRTAESANGGGLARNTTVTINLGGGATTIQNGILQFGDVAGTYNTAGQTVNISPTLNVSGGTVNIGATAGTSITMGRVALTGTNGQAVTVNATINLTGGTTTLAGDVVRVGTTGTSSGGITNTATITLNGGTLDVGGNEIGTAGSNVTVNAQAGMLMNAGAINGAGGITKTTAGTLLLNGTNTYSGATVVTAGTVGGTGSIAGALTVNPGGTVAPGASIGTLRVGGPVSLTAGVGTAPTLETELQASSGASITDDSDVLALTGAGAAGALDLSNPDQLNLIALTAVTTPTTYTIATFAPGQLTGTFETLLVNGVVTTNTTQQGQPNFVSVLYDNAGGTIQITVNNLAAVPEPSAVGLVGAAAAGLLARRRRRA